MAKQTKPALVAACNTAIPDNLTSDVSPADIRNILLDILDSYPHLDEARNEVVAANALMVELTDQATITWDANDGHRAKVTLAGNRTIEFPSNLEDGSEFSLIVIQDATGSRTLAWDTRYYFEGGTTPTLSTAAGAIDKFDFVALFNGLQIVGLNGSGGLASAGVS